MDNTKKYDIIAFLIEHFDVCRIKEINIYETGYANAKIFHDGMEISLTIREVEEDA
jgi:hypothetical protein